MPTLNNVSRPRYQPGDIVIMDNALTHTVNGAAEAAGATPRYLPQYSPDLNPIEQAFRKLKALVRKAAERYRAHAGSNGWQNPRQLPPCRLHEFPTKLGLWCDVSGIRSRPVHRPFWHRSLPWGATAGRAVAIRLPRQCPGYLRSVLVRHASRTEADAVVGDIRTAASVGFNSSAQPHADGPPLLQLPFFRQHKTVLLWINLLRRTASSVAPVSWACCTSVVWAFKLEDISL